MFQYAEPEKIQKHVITLLNAFTQVIDHYQGAALISLFDAIATLAEMLQDQLQDQ